jgi:hypothetical protein
MLDLSDALGSGRLKPPYSTLQMAEYVPELASDDIVVDLARIPFFIATVFICGTSPDPLIIRIASASAQRAPLCGP